MIRWMFYVMVFLGSALMIYNIYGFHRFAHVIQGMKMWSSGKRILYLPIFLLVLFLLGYLLVGFFGEPDLVVAGILFGGSLFVFVVYKLFSGIIQRVFEIEHLEAELLSAEKSNRAKSDFLASVSHEMRTPMNVIQGLDTLALKNPELPDETRSQLERIGHSAHYLSGLINDILDMQLIEGGEMTLRSETFSMKDLLEQISGIVSSLCDEKGLDYRMSMDDGAAQDYIGDAPRIQRAVMSLMENAVKFTDAPGTVLLTVSSARSEEGRDALRFTVSDTGIGIDEAFLPRILEPFTQEDASFTNRFGGSGMGLAVANSIVSRMGGAIEARSRKGKGSVFTICLPVGDGALSVAPKSEAGDSPALNPAQELKGRRILIVDDLPENAEIVSDLLELEEVESEWAENGLVAVQMVENAEPYYYDAILMDLRMPVMDGLTATREIRRLDRPDAATVPIIALTANAFESDVQQSLEAGMNAHIAKPFQPEALARILMSHIGPAADKTAGHEQ